jgi:CPA2 family monovalent cation:H+ antiporter-2
VHELRPGLPVVVRTHDDRDMDRLTQAGAAEVVPETLEASLMLSSHALVLVGIPLNRVLRRIRDTRMRRYHLLRGFFHGLSDTDEESGNQLRLHSVWLEPGSRGIGKRLGDFNLAAAGCEISSIRRRGITGVEPAPETVLEEGDVVVLLGKPEALAVGEERLLRK